MSKQQFIKHATSLTLVELVCYHLPPRYLGSQVFAYSSSSIFYHESSLYKISMFELYYV